jgi:hypothetical protein
MNKPAENVALELLARDGVAVIWKIHVAAAQAWRIGHIAGAEVLLDIADAAETILRGELPPSKRAGDTVPSRRIRARSTPDSYAAHDGRYARYKN